MPLAVKLILEMKDKRAGAGQKSFDVAKIR